MNHGVLSSGPFSTHYWTRVQKGRPARRHYPSLFAALRRAYPDVTIESIPDALTGRVG